MNCPLHFWFSPCLPKPTFRICFSSPPDDFFRNTVRQSGGDRHTKWFGSWDLLVTIIYGQLHQVRSLRTLTTEFGSQSNLHDHLNAQAMERDQYCPTPCTSAAPIHFACCVKLLDRWRLIDSLLCSKRRPETCVRGQMYAA